MTPRRIPVVGALLFGLLLSLSSGTGAAAAATIHLTPSQRESFALMPHSRGASDAAGSGAVRIASGIVMQLAQTPTDPFYPDQWYLSNTGQDDGGTVGTVGDDVHAETAWDLATGAGQTVAVVDTGVQPDQPDLAGALWTNPGEVPGNGVDDDHDGLVDDVNGWSFSSNSPDVSDDVGHGTVVAGEIAATPDNGYGISGLAYGAKVMPLQVGRSESINTAYAAKAFEYAASHGAVAANASFGGPADSVGLEAAIAKEPQTIFVVAAGNNGTDNDRYPFYPCNFKELNVICVAATDSQDRLASFSNYGRASVDLAAPGDVITSTFIGSQLADGDGTSFAAPLVSATVALVKQRFPGYDAVQIRQKILGSVDRVPGLAGKVATSGRLDAAAALAPTDGIPPKTTFPGQKHLFTRNSATIRTRVDQPGSELECKLQGSGPWVGCSTGHTIKVDTKILEDRRYRLVVRAVGTDGEAERKPAVFHFKVEHPSGKSR